jgi:putative ABC transport system substrate-binding protein
MNRREAIAAVLVLGAAPLAAQAQPARKVWRVGFLSISTPNPAYLGPLQQGLRELGYVEGRNITIDYRFAAGKMDRLAADAADLVRQKVDLIIAGSTQPAIAAMKETSTIPIVVAVSGDAVGTGLVKSLARPGGNVTGQTIMAPEVSGKRLELIKASVPAVTRVGVLWNPIDPARKIEFRETEAAAQRLGIKLFSAEVSVVADIRSGFTALSNERAEALIVFLDPFTLRQRALIADLAIKARLPLMAADAEITKAGALMSYGPSIAALFRTAAAYVDKILKGATPADLPVAQPTEFELVVNLKTAKALELALSQSLLIRADRVIE